MTRALESAVPRAVESALYRVTEDYEFEEPGEPVLTRPSLIGTPSVFPSSNTAGTATTIAIPTPAGATIGEALLVCLTSSGTTATDITLPSGWARIGLAAINDGNIRILGWFIHHLTATPAASYSFTSPIAGRFGGIMMRLLHAHTTQPHKAWHLYGARNAATIEMREMTTALGTAPTEDSLYLVSAGLQVAAGTSTAYSSGPSGLTAVTSTYFGLDSGSRTGLHIFQANVTAGQIAAGPVITFAAAPASATANGIVLRGALV